jgi:hypothetical protein
LSAPGSQSAKLHAGDFGHGTFVYKSVLRSIGVHPSPTVIIGANRRGRGVKFSCALFGRLAAETNQVSYAADAMRNSGKVGLIANICLGALANLTSSEAKEGL